MRAKFDTIMTPLLLRRFQDEATFEDGDGRYYAVVHGEDGRIFVHHPGSPTLSAEQLMFATDILQLLHRELHHDGAWVMVFTRPAQPDGVISIENPKHWEYERFGFIFIDADGDPQFTYEWERGGSELLDFTEVLLAGPHSWANKCETAWQTWAMSQKALDLRPDQTFRQAKGEAMPSTARH